MDNKQVRELDDSELNSTKSDQQWYVLHHPVTNPNKPERLLRVCNAASKYNCLPLTDENLAGHDLMQSLVGFVFQFRQYSITATAEVEAMFLQVKVPVMECKFLLLLWRDNGRSW